MYTEEQAVPVDYSALTKSMTYQVGNRTFVVETVFDELSPDTLGSLLLRLMKIDCET